MPAHLQLRTARNLLDSHIEGAGGLQSVKDLRASLGRCCNDARAILSGAISDLKELESTERGRLALAYMSDPTGHALTALTEFCAHMDAALAAYDRFALAMENLPG